MAPFDAAKEGYELTEIDGGLVLFTNMRLSRGIVLAGIFCYDVRDSDALDRDMVEIKVVVVVNHWGTILYKDPSPADEYGNYHPEDWGYPGKDMNFEEFQEIGREQPAVYLLPEAPQTEPIMQKSLPQKGGDAVLIALPAGQVEKKH